MVFGLETFWPASDGWSAARIEEEIVVTESGHEIITRFPAEQLIVAGAHYFTATGPLPTIREIEPQPSPEALALARTVDQAQSAKPSLDPLGEMRPPRDQAAT